LEEEIKEEKEGRIYVELSMENNQLLLRIYLSRIFSSNSGKRKKKIIWSFIAGV